MGIFLIIVCIYMIVKNNNRNSENSI
ncbi:hypothetical protein [Carnobacterium maltaromaticum]